MGHHGRVLDEGQDAILVGTVVEHDDVAPVLDVSIVLLDLDGARNDGSQGESHGSEQADKERQFMHCVLGKEWTFGELRERQWGEAEKGVSHGETLRAVGVEFIGNWDDQRLGNQRQTRATRTRAVVRARHGSHR